MAGRGAGARRGAATALSESNLDTTFTWNSSEDDWQTEDWEDGHLQGEDGDVHEEGVGAAVRAELLGRVGDAGSCRQVLHAQRPDAGGGAAPSCAQFKLPRAMLRPASAAAPARYRATGASRGTPSALRRGCSPCEGCGCPNIGCLARRSLFSLLCTPGNISATRRGIPLRFLCYTKRPVAIWQCRVLLCKIQANLDRLPQCYKYFESLMSGRWRTETEPGQSSSAMKFTKVHL